VVLCAARGAGGGAGMSSPLAAGPPAADLATLRALLARRAFAEALERGTALLATAPDHRDLLYAVAVAERYLGRIPAALATLERLERHHPNYSRLYQERGHCHLAHRDAPQAIAAFLQAVHRNPALPASWRLLEGLARRAGDADLAATAARHVARLGQLAADVVAATSLHCDGDLDEAEALIRAYLGSHPEDIEAMRLLARIALDREAPEDAETLLKAVLERVPDYAAARYDYARALMQGHQHPAAQVQLDQLLQAEPDSTAYRTASATNAASLGDHERAIRLYTALIGESPQSAELSLSLGHALKTVGRQDEAIAAYRQAAALRADFGDAYWSLANLKTYRFGADDVGRMRTLEARPQMRAADRYSLCFALGKALEDGGEYRESFRYYARGNALKRAEIRYRSEFIGEIVRRQIAACTPGLFAAQPGAGCRDPAPIFIVGLPRAGSTLIEQILASHPAVEGTMELPNLPRLARNLRADRHETLAYPQGLAELTPAERLQLGERYLAQTRIYRTGKPYFIDKMPNNFRHVGLIRLILPEARIIDARREAMACCFGNFKQLFALGQEFTYSLTDLGAYYRGYLELMAHWDRVLPGQVLRVDHERVVEDLEGSVRRLLAFCGLPFDAACLDFHRSPRVVRTASSEQVRRPIYRDGLDQWRHFAPDLGELRAALGDAARP
jgi:tetratricopeptide (TPR) repeat protein